MDDRRPAEYQQSSSGKATISPVANCSPRLAGPGRARRATKPSHAEARLPALQQFVKVAAGVLIDDQALETGKVLESKRFKEPVELGDATKGRDDEGKNSAYRTYRERIEWR